MRLRLRRRRDRYYRAALKFSREYGYEGDELPKGRRWSASSCPLARATGASAATSRYILFAGSSNPRQEVLLPAAVGEFVRRFDQDHYPDLIAESS